MNKKKKITTTALCAIQLISSLSTHVNSIPITLFLTSLFPIILFLITLFHFTITLFPITLFPNILTRPWYNIQPYIGSMIHQPQCIEDASLFSKRPHLSRFELKFDFIFHETSHFSGMVFHLSMQRMWS